MSPIVKCSSCRKVMTQKQFSMHTCEPTYNGTKTISVVEILDLSWKKDMKKLLATGLDGVDYLIEIQKPIAMPFVVTTNSRRKATPFRTDEEETEPTSSIYKGGGSSAESQKSLQSTVTRHFPS